MQTKNSVSGQDTKPFKVGDIVENQGHVALVIEHVFAAGIPHLKVMITSLGGCAAVGQTYAVEAKHCDLLGFLVTRDRIDTIENGGVLAPGIINFMQARYAAEYAHGTHIQD